MPQNNPKNKNLLQKQQKASQSGNVFFIILLAVALFAALAFTVARGMRGDNVEQMSEQQATLKASSILTSAQKIQRSVDRLRRKGISESDLSFDQSFVAGYSHGQPDTNKIFNPSGGSIKWQTPPENANDGSDWFITGASCIADLGTGASGCESDANTGNEELILALPNIVDAVCTAINNRLGITGIPADSGGGVSTTQFAGSFADGTLINVAGGPFNAVCFSRSGSNTFYQVLIER